MLYGKTYGGADPEMTEGDIFHIEISIPEFSANPAKTQTIKPFLPDKDQDQADDETQVTPQVTPQVARILELAITEQSLSELQTAAALKDRVHFLKTYLKPFLLAGWLERTIPDKPRSSKQKYRLTAKGRAVLDAQQSKKN